MADRKGRRLFDPSRSVRRVPVAVIGWLITWRLRFLMFIEFFITFLQSAIRPYCPPHDRTMEAGYLGFTLAVRAFCSDFGRGVLLSQSCSVQCLI